MDFLVCWSVSDLSCLGIPAPIDFVEKNKTKSLKMFWQYCAAESDCVDVHQTMMLAVRLDGLVSTTASQERIFSTYSDVLANKKRSRLRSKLVLQTVFLKRRLNAKLNIAKARAQTAISSASGSVSTSTSTSASTSNFASNSESNITSDDIDVFEMVIDDALNNVLQLDASDDDE